MFELYGTGMKTQQLEEEEEEEEEFVTYTVIQSRGVASFSKVRGMDVVCLLTIKKMNSMTEGYKRYNIQDIKSFPFK